MNFSFDNHSPVYLQIASALEEAILSGEFQPEEKLPSVREIASRSQTNPNTVVKTMAELENKGLIETRRTSGKYVSANPKALELQRESRARMLRDTYFSEMSKLGYTRAEAIELAKKGAEDAAES